MAHVLVYVWTHEGQTQRIAERMGEVLHELGHEVSIEVNPRHGVDLEPYDAYILAGSIHVGQHQPELRHFARTHARALEMRPNAFVSVSLTARDPDPDKRRQVWDYIHEFAKETNWYPDRVGCFAGALRYSEYGWLKRLIMKRISKAQGADTDTSRDYEYTNWESVEDFARDFAADLEARAAARSKDLRAVDSA
jgi:menaquinone-dependent protoporphyrinogen oxidase